MGTNLIGIDCATVPKKVGLVRGLFDGGKARVVEVVIGSKSPPIVDTIVNWIDHSTNTLIAIDAPLGWPLDLGIELITHEASASLNTVPNRMFRRETDRFIKDKLGKQPLDVGADRIARTAHAALHLLEEIRNRTGDPIPLAWEPTQLKLISAIEVYPAATMLANDIQVPQGYKQKDNYNARKNIITELRTFLNLPIDTTLIEQSDHALDAVLCVLAASDFLSGKAYPPDDMDKARKEGWIWVRKPDY